MQRSHFLVAAASWVGAVLFGVLSKGNGASVRVIVRAEDFGVVGDGSADDSAALQRALNAAARNGGTVVLRPGRHLVLNAISLPSNVSLFLGPVGHVVPG